MNERFSQPVSEASPLWRAVYAELRELADRQMKRERADHTLQPTALVHEAYLRLTGEGGLDIALSDRAHFLGIAAKVIRRILVDHARSRARQKRGRGFVRVDFHEDHGVAWPRDVDALALDEALNQLQDLSDRQARVIELRFFAGLTVEETAQSLGVSIGTVKNEWRFARAWLHQRLSDG